MKAFMADRYVQQHCFKIHLYVSLSVVNDCPSASSVSQSLRLLAVLTIHVSFNYHPDPSLPLPRCSWQGVPAHSAGPTEWSSVCIILASRLPGSTNIHFVAQLIHQLYQGIAVHGPSSWQKFVSLLLLMTNWKTGVQAVHLLEKLYLSLSTTLFARRHMYLHICTIPLCQRSHKTVCLLNAMTSWEEIFSFP